jgi:hypothetical protein
MEMDIYMRRRLVALGGLVAFFILFVLLVKSFGGDDEPEAPLTTVGATGTGGAVALTTEEFIAQADDICAAANAAVGALDPTDPTAVREESQITADELAQLQSLQVEDEDRVLTQFFRFMEDLTAALKSKQVATQRGDTVSADEAQLAIDEAEVEARALGERYGFRDCGQFLNAGEAPGGADTGTDATAPTDTGGVAPVAPTAPPADTTAPPVDTAPPADDTGGITP